MIYILHTGGSKYVMDFKEQETIGELIQRFKDEGQFQFRSTATVQDTKVGRVTSPNELVMDERSYALNVWLAANAERAANR